VRLESAALASKHARQPLAAAAVTVLVVSLLGCGPGRPETPRSTQPPPPQAAVPASDSARPASVPESRTPRIPPDTTGVATGPGSRELDPAQIPPGAYRACQRSAAVQLPAPERAVWSKLPDKVERTASGEYALVAQVRPDSASPGLSFACVVAQEGEGWRVVEVEAR
jgi:hypothetical protein